MQGAAAQGGRPEARPRHTGAVPLGYPEPPLADGVVSLRGWRKADIERVVSIAALRPRLGAGLDLLDIGLHRLQPAGERGGTLSSPVPSEAAQPCAFAEPRINFVPRVDLPLRSPPGVPSCIRSPATCPDTV